ncbi:MAG: bifunctional N(6)-L-threonylcarbamoyladenine synthase/serine/threonine protein kinase [Nanoarchaeota archaeon]|nr:bifunctional N(6)-L-threonylcarbamoyladenine synthase/serine/threonine protein kinase [Nanoarchaeota archaeon]MBU1703989.1 bifunctional N(6)-L-threonylcarbamoyladenine synthase/serine/threonine protein kinase [Nanoarchaeota archaeon]
MRCLGIESTAHTFGASVVTDKGKVLSNVKHTYTTESGGIIPTDAAEHHVKFCDEIMKKALDEAKCSIKDIGLISFSQSPGIGNCLRIGAFAARSLAAITHKPIVGVNHCIAHLEIGRLLTSAKDPVLLYASGANTQVIAYDGGKYRIFGETLDQGVGNFIDSFARHIGLGFPGGPKVYELSLKGKEYIELPYVVKGMDVSFGGLLTNLKQKYDSGKYKVEDLCYSLQETVFAMLIEVSERALAHCEKTELLLGGGVACNKRLQEMCHKMCDDRGARCYVPEMQFLVDNAAMIAWQGILEYKAGKRQDIDNTQIDPYERTDDIIVNWR